VRIFIPSYRLNDLNSSQPADDGIAANGIPPPGLTFTMQLSFLTHRLFTLGYSSKDKGKGKAMDENPVEDTPGGRPFFAFSLLFLTRPQP
jgi:hypothetical protein